MKQGDYQMPACQNATYQANVFDQYIITAQYENLSTKVKQAAYKAYAYLRHFGFYFVNEDTLKSDNKPKQLKAQISFAPNMRSANVSLDSPAASWAKYLPVHPDHDVIDRLAYQATQGQSEGKLKRFNQKISLLIFELFQQPVLLTKTMLTLSTTSLTITMFITAGMLLS
jgi:hypothetical protein